MRMHICVSELNPKILIVSHVLSKKNLKTGKLCAEHAVYLLCIHQSEFDVHCLPADDKFLQQLRGSQTLFKVESLGSQDEHRVYACIHPIADTHVQWPWIRLQIGMPYPLTRLTVLLRETWTSLV